MGELRAIPFKSDSVGPEEVLDALEGYIENRDVENLICIGEDVDGNLSIVMTDMTNTELVGTLQIAIMNYIHGWQHDD